MRWKDNLARIGRAAIMYDANNLWNHIAGATNNHRVDGQFRAQIKDVTPEGRLVLQREDSWERAYAFKEVRFDAE